MPPRIPPSRVVPVMTAMMMVTVAYFAHRNNWGADIKFEWVRVAKAGIELLVVIGWPFLSWLLI